MITRYRSHSVYPRICGEAVSSFYCLFTLALDRCIMYTEHLGWVKEYDGKDSVRIDDGPNIFKINLRNGDKEFLVEGRVNKEFYTDPSLRFCLERGETKEQSDEFTRVVDRNGSIVFENNDEFFGLLDAYSDDYFLFSWRKKKVLERNTGEILWESRVRGTVIAYNDCSFFLVYKSDRKEGSFTKIEYKSGEPIMQLPVPTSIFGPTVNGEEVVYIGMDDAGAVSYNRFHIPKEEIHTLLLDNLGEDGEFFRPMSESLHTDDLVYIERKFQDAYVVEQKPDCIRRYSPSSGEFKGEVMFPGDLRLMTFSILNGSYAAVCRPREFSHGAPHSLFIWDEDEWTRRTEVRSVSPITTTDRIVEEDETTSYRVSVVNRGEGAFDLFCQLSAELYKAGAEAGLCLVDEEKERDPDFSGRIICDLTSIEVSGEESKGLKKLCETAAESLSESFFRPSIDPAEKITVTPIFRTE